MADDSTTSRLLDKAAAAILEPFQQAVKVVYIDADMLFDYRLGALLLKIDNQQQYDYIIKHLPEYEKGASRKITKYFPDLKITEEVLDVLESDIDYGNMIVKLAPRTVFYEELQGFIASVNTFNQGKNIDNPLKIVINQRKLNIPDAIKQQIAIYIHNVDSSVTVEFSNYSSWLMVPDNEFASYDMLVVEDLTDFVRIGTTSQRFMAKNECETKIVFAPIQSEKEFDNPEDEAEAVSNTAKAFDMVLGKFQFINKTLAIKR